MKQLTFGGINMGDMIIGLCVSLIVVGTLVILVSLLGLIGACSGNQFQRDIPLLFKNKCPIIPARNLDEDKSGFFAEQLWLR